MRGVLKAKPGVPFLSRRIRPPVPLPRLARSWMAAWAARSGVEPAGRRKSAAAFAMTTFMMASPKPVEEIAAGFGICIATTTDKGRIADAAGKFAAGATGRSCGEEMAVQVKGNSAYGALFVTAVMFGSMGVFTAAKPGFALSGRDKFFGIAKRVYRDRRQIALLLRR